MFKFSAKLLTADAWDGVDTKIHLQDNHYWAKKVFNGLKSQFGQISQQYKIKGVALQEWIKEYGMQGLFAAQERDPAIRKAMNDVRSLLKDTVVSTDQGGQYRNNEIDAFKKEHGSNVADWLFELTGQKRANRKKKDKTGSEKCRYCEAPVAARWWEHGETPMCSQCIQEDEATQENFVPRSKGVISGLLATKTAAPFLAPDRFAPPTLADEGPEPRYEDFKDIEVLYMDADENDYTVRVSGTLSRDEWGDITMELDPASEQMLQGVDMQQNEILHQITEQVHI